MAVLPSNAVEKVKDLLQSHLLVDHVCECSPGLFDALVDILSVEEVSKDGVLVTAKILEPTNRLEFAGTELRPWCCSHPDDHQRVTDVLLMVPAYTYEEYIFGNFPVRAMIHGCQWKY